MSLTISQLVIGSKIRVQEGENWVDYWVMENDDAGAVIMRDKLLADNQKRNTGNAAKWPDSPLDVWLNDSSEGFISTLSTAAQNALALRNIETYVFENSAIQQIPRKVWIPSYMNLMGTGDGTIPPEGKDWSAQLYLITGAWGNDARKAMVTDTAGYWWTRTIKTQWLGYLVNTSGALVDDNPKSGYKVRPVLNIAPTTVVIDAGDGAYALTGDGNVPTYHIEATEIVSKCVERPVKARVIYNTVDLTNVSVWVSNNAADVEPVWVDATSGNEVVLTNETKTSENWMLGVKYYGECTAPNHGYFTEPELFTVEVI